MTCKTMSCSDFANQLVTKIGPSPRALSEGPPRETGADGGGTGGVNDGCPSGAVWEGTVTLVDGRTLGGGSASTAFPDSSASPAISADRIRVYSEIHVACTAFSSFFTLESLIVPWHCDVQLKLREFLKHSTPLPSKWLVPVG
ncbi:hypothetical protein OUZ56_018422 [Daphnia magna]|uniref:Uncharacterized protein n=1 Tax=Daphnia magna TaxID=35525 RepID=A0ABQ9Z8T5_9CRUS|nr:hypothetical protein OUZ56_018422 [Daphnia magna]